MPHLMQERQAFLSRLEEIAADMGGKAALARAVKLPPTSLQNYFDQETEPKRPVLVALADAAGVSISWLASGRGEKRGGDAPDGYLWVPCYDLSETGPYLRGMVGLPGTRLLFRRDDVDSLGKWISGNILAVSGTKGIGFHRDIRDGDTFIIVHPHGHAALRPSPVDGWKLQDDLIYLVADGIALKLRKLHRRGGSVSVIGPDEKRDRTLTGTPHDFILFGPVIWRSGAICPKSESA